MSETTEPWKVEQLRVKNTTEMNEVDNIRQKRGTKKNKFGEHSGWKKDARLDEAKRTWAEDTTLWLNKIEKEKEWCNLGSIPTVNRRNWTRSWQNKMMGWREQQHNASGTNKRMEWIERRETRSWESMLTTNARTVSEPRFQVTSI